MRFRLTVLDKYMFKRFFVGFVVSSTLFIFFILLFDMMNQMKHLSNVSFGKILLMYYYKGYFQFTLVAPASALFSTIYAINSLAKNNELIAIVSSGMSIYRLTISVALFGLLFSLFLVPFNDYVVFPAQKKAEKISDKARRKYRNRNNNQRDVKVWGENGLFYKARSYRNKQKKLVNLVVLKMRDKQQPERVDRVPFYPDKKNNLIKSDIPDNTTNNNEYQEWRDDRYLNDVLPLSLASLWRYRVDAKYALYNKTRHGWYLFDGVIWDFDKKGMKAHRFKKRFFPFVEIPYDFAKEILKIHAMTTVQAKRYIDKLKKSGEDYGKEQVEYYLKYSFPLVNFVIILIGISLGGFSSKSVMILSFFISLGIYIVYYLIVALGLSFGKLGVLSPIIGAWLGDAIFALIAIILLIRRKT